MTPARDGPGRPRHTSGRGIALALAIAVHVVFLAVLIFSVRWQNRPPEPVTAELYAPPPKAAPPEPRPEPKPEPRPEPRPVKPPPEPKVEKTEPKPDIALKAKQEAEKKERERKDAEKRERVEAEKKKQEERRVAEARERQEAEKKKLEERRQAEARERQERVAQELKAQAERERQEREALVARERAEREAQLKADAANRARAEFSRAQADYIARIQAKVRGYVRLPPDIAGNPEAIYDVVQLPTGEILEATLRKSSGVRAYDEAVQRAILLASPLPRPDRPELFQRTLTLKFRPRD